MLRSKIIFILPLLTVAMTVANSSGFVFLVADERLTQYLICSSIYSLFVWTSHWIVPSAFNFAETALPDIRFLQWSLAALGVAALNVTVPSAVSLAFSVVLVSEIVFFHSGILVIYSKTAIFHILEISRGTLNLLNLLICVLLFDGSPSYLVLGMALNVFIIGIISWRLGNRAVTISPTSFSLPALARVTSAALGSRNTRLMLLARFFEIVTILALTSLKALSAVIAVKLAVMITQAVSLNSRSSSFVVITTFSLAVLVSTISCVIVFSSVWPISSSPALQTLTWSSLGAAVLFQLPFVLLLYHSLAKPSLKMHSQTPE